MTVNPSRLSPPSCRLPVLVQWSSSAAGEHRAPGSEFGTSWTGWDVLGPGAEDSLGPGSEDSLGVVTMAGVSVCEDPCVDDMLEDSQFSQFSDSLRDMPDIDCVDCKCRLRISTGFSSNTMTPPHDQVEPMEVD